MYKDKTKQTYKNKTKQNQTKQKGKMTKNIKILSLALIGSVVIASSIASTIILLNKDKKEKIVSSETKIKELKSHFDINSNVEIELPKNKIYNSNFEILEDVKKEISKNSKLPISYIKLISLPSGNKKRDTRKIENDSKLTINIGNEDYILNLKYKKEYTKNVEEGIKILKEWINKNNILSLPKGRTYNNIHNIYKILKEVIMKNLVSKKINFSALPLLMFSEKDKNVVSISKDRNNPTLIRFELNNEEISLKLYENETFDDETKIKVDFLKKYFEDKNNREIKIPKGLYFEDDKNSELFEKILKEIQKKEPEVETNLIVLDRNKTTDSLNTIKKEGTKIIVKIDDSLFSLIVIEKNNFDIEKEKPIVEAIKNYFENLKGWNKLRKISLPKMTYSSVKDIFYYVKNHSKLFYHLLNDKKLIEKTSIENFNNYIILKAGQENIKSVPVYDRKGVELVIIVDGQEYTLSLNQDQFSQAEKQKFLSDLNTYFINNRIILENKIFSSIIRVYKNIIENIKSFSGISNIIENSSFIKNMEEKNQNFDFNNISKEHEKPNIFYLKLFNRVFAIKVNQKLI